MGAKRRLREAVATSQVPQLKRGQDDNDPPRRKRGTGKGKRKRARGDHAAATTRESVRFIAQLREVDVHEKTGSAYSATIVREGAGNDHDANYYTKDALRKAVADGLFEGLQAYANHPTPTEERERPERDVRQLVGHFREARYVDGNPAEVRAKFVPVTGTGYEWVTSLIESALHSVPGRPLIGISIDGHGHAPDRQEVKGRTYNMVREITHLGSADIVTRAGAGGRFHRRLQESLRDAVPGDPTTLSPAKLQKRVRKALARLEEAFAAEDDEQAADAVVALREAASARVKVARDPAGLARTEVAAGSNAEELERLRGQVDDLQTKLSKQRKRRRRAESRADLADRARIAGKMLREAGVSGRTAELWMDELLEQPNKPAMRALLERRQAQRSDDLAELREAAGLCEVEGVPRREPPGFSGPPRVSLLDRMNIDRDELEAPS